VVGATVVLGVSRRRDRWRGERERRRHECCEKHPLHLCNLLDPPTRRALAVGIALRHRAHTIFTRLEQTSAANVGDALVESPRAREETQCNYTVIYVIR